MYSFSGASELNNQQQNYALTIAILYHMLSKEINLMCI